MWLLLFLKFQQWDRCKNILSRAQLAEKSLVTPEVHCSIQSSANTCQLYRKDKKREKETGGMARLKDFLCASGEILMVKNIRCLQFLIKIFC